MKRSGMEMTNLCWPLSVSSRAAGAVLLAFFFSSLSFGADVTWTGAIDNDWDTGRNWDNGSGLASGDYAYVPSGTVNFSSGSVPSLRGFRHTGGVLNFSGATIEASSQASAYSQFDGTVTQTAGFASINAIRVGVAANSNGSYSLNGGEMRIARATGDGVSLYLGGLSSGNGSMIVAGGSLATRNKVQLGSATASGTGTFTVLGTQASSIGVATANDNADGQWNQYPGSSLVLRFDIGGTTPIFLRDDPAVEGAASATFEDGSILDVDYLSGDGGGTWTVMEVENGDIVDNGLEFAPGVDTSIWSFSVDNSGSNGRLLVTAIGDPVGYPLVVGETEQQKMRYGMDYERLWYWTGGLNDSERNDIAKWSAVDTRIDFIRVAINSAYELEEGVYDLDAYDNKIFPMMHKMQDANPDIKFFASPRPLNEAVSGVSWQPYPQWVTGDDGDGNFNFDWEKCAEYLERYLVLMSDNGFKISFLDLSNEWQSSSSKHSPGTSSRINQADVRYITEYLKASTVLSGANIEVPLFIAPSSWNYQQGGSWITNINSGSKRAAVDIAASHNTDKTGTAEEFGSRVRAEMGNDTEIWNTEVHGWKSTSNANETTTFSFYLEQIQAGFSGLTGWLAIGTTNQGHSYILNPNGRPSRNVKYFIFKKLSETSNYGYNLDLIETPEQLSHTVALIKGNLMTVWVINQRDSAVPVVITPNGREISEGFVKRTRWTDPSDVEGFVTEEPVNSATSLSSTIPAQSVCCFEILLEPKEFSYVVIQAENDDQRSDDVPRNEQSSDDDGTDNLAYINNSSWARYNDIVLTENSAMRFRTARPFNTDDGWIEVYLGASGESTASILDGTPAGKVAVPTTGNWQLYETIEAALENAGGKYDIVINFAEVGSDDNNYLFNLNWLSVVSPESVLMGDANADGIVSNLDISAFVLALFQPTMYELLYPDVDPVIVLDMNQDGALNNLDIGAFSTALGF